MTTVIPGDITGGITVAAAITATVGITATGGIIGDMTAGTIIGAGAGTIAVRMAVGKAALGR